MVSAETYVKIILKRRNISQAQLLRKMLQLKLAEEKTLCAPKLNNALNVQMGYTWARRIELALDLPKYSLVKMVGSPTEAQWKVIEEVKINV